MSATSELKRILEVTSELPEAFTTHIVGLDCKSVDNLANWAVDTEEAVTALCDGTQFGTRPKQGKDSLGRAEHYSLRVEGRNWLYQIAMEDRRSEYLMDVFKSEASYKDGQRTPEPLVVP